MECALKDLKCMCGKCLTGCEGDIKERVLFDGKIKAYMCDKHYQILVTEYKIKKDNE